MVQMKAYFLIFMLLFCTSAYAATPVGRGLTNQSQIETTITPVRVEGEIVTVSSQAQFKTVPSMAPKKIDNTSKYPTKLTQKAYEMISEKWDYSGAIDILNKAIKKNQNDIFAHYLLAKVCYDWAVFYRHMDNDNVRFNRYKSIALNEFDIVKNLLPAPSLSGKFGGISILDIEINASPTSDYNMMNTEINNLNFKGTPLSFLVTDKFFFRMNYGKPKKIIRQEIMGYHYEDWFYKDRIVGFKGDEKISDLEIEE